MNEKAREAGFSTMEAIVSIALIAIAGTLMLWVSAVSIRSLGATKDRVTLAADVLAVDSSLRSAVGRVRIPWWERRVRVTDEGSRASVPWLDGNPEGVLTIAEDNGRLVIGGPDGSVIYRSRVKIDSLNVSAIANDTGVPTGLEIRYVLGGEPIACSAPFASRALESP